MPCCIKNAHVSACISGSCSDQQEAVCVVNGWNSLSYVANFGA